MGNTRLMQAANSMTPTAAKLAFATIVAVGLLGRASFAGDGGAADLAHAVIVMGEAAASPEKQAASELARYLAAICGTQIPVRLENDPQAEEASLVLVVGRPVSSRTIRSLSEAGHLRLTDDDPGHDGFMVKQLSHQGKDYVVFASAVSRGCLFAVYHFLEKHLQVGFFWDGDHIPREQEISFAGLDIVVRPRFPYREYMQGTAFTYSAQFWSFEQWKNELDWMAKKRLNMVQLASGGVTMEIPMRRALRRMGVEMATPLSAWHEHETVLFQKVNRYARNLGIITVQPMFAGEVPHEMKQVYPDADYMEVRWLDLPPGLNLRPSDPLFEQLATYVLQEYGAVYGTDGYFNADPYPETNPGSQARVTFGHTIARAIRAAHPDGKWVCSGWAFRDWSNDAVEEFLQPIPDDMFLVNDIWAERSPIYKRLDYFYGKPWGFSVLHSMGGWTVMHGHLGDLVGRVHALMADLQAGRCVNFYINPEIVHHNDVYFDLAAELANDPTETNLPDFLDDYLIRRYGRDAAPRMKPVWDELLQSVYGHHDMTRPHYWETPYEGVPESVETLRKHYIPHLKTAGELALAESGRLADNPFYLRDLVDITRQYVAEVYNHHMAELLAALEAKDQSTFDRHAAVLRQCLESQVKILSSHRAFQVRPEIDRALLLPRHDGHNLFEDCADNGEVVRQRYTALAGIRHYPTLANYAARDMYEVMQYYYRKRAHAFIDHLGQRLQAPERASENLEKKWRDLTEAFIKTPFEAYDDEPPDYLGKAPLAAQEVLREIAAVRDRVTGE